MAIVAGIAGALAEPIGKVIQGVAADDAGKYNQAVAEANARNAEADGVAEIERLRVTARLAMGRQAAGLAASGFQMDGSALDALMESQIESELEIAQTRRRATLQGRGFESDGRVARAAGYNQAMGHYVGAAASVYKGFEKAAAAGGGG